MIKENDKLHGFKVTAIKDAPECGGKLVYMTYEKTGTELVWVDNKESNKLFSITFKTLPEDNTGVFHILEHSVLCGSEKYPVKEPFVDLLKSSMHTFLNAMTFQDKTMYPVSSRNDKDFLNLTSVYLDAVFAPAILKNKNIFCQEGWHIEQDEDGKLSYKGVVFNEMKGVMSGKDGLIEESLLPVLFPDNCYGVNSGGDPEHIPELTYEQFIDTYKRFYHPSNARVFLDGNIPLDETLELIEGYLCKFEKSDNLPVFVPQQPKSSEKTITYAIGDEEDLKDKAQLTIAKIISSWDDPIRTQAAGVIFNALSDSNDSPFKKAILDAGLAQDLEISVNDEMAQIYLTIDAKNVTDGKEEEIIALIKKVAKEQVEKGIDRKALIASINYGEFKLKTQDEPAGLVRAIKAMLSWLYGGDPIMYLESGYMFKELRAMLESDAYEKLLSDILLNDDGMCILKALPSKTRAAEQDAKEAAKLEEIRKGWSEEDKQANKLLNEELCAWQQTPDSPENCATIPVLPLSEVGTEPDFTKTEVSTQADVKVLYHPISTNGVVNFSLYFRLTDRSIEELTELNEVAALLSYLPTTKHSALELEQEIKTYLGQLNFGLGVFSNKDELNAATPLLIANCSVLEENLAKAKELIYEILSSTVFDKEYVQDILLQSDMRLKQMGITSGHALGRFVALSGYSADDAVNEALNGYTHITRLHQICEDFDNQADRIIAQYEDMLKKACCRKRLTASVTSSSPVDLSDLFGMLPEGEDTANSREYKSNLSKNTGLKIPALIGFAVQGVNIDAIDVKYSGSLSVACNLLSLDYFWNVVRVQGGAYGTGLRAGIGGSIFTYSYRDPSLKRTIDVNKGAAEHLRNYALSGGEIDKYIISAVAGTEPLLPPQARGALADRDYFCGYTYDVLKKQRSEMLATDKDALIAAADVIEKFANKGALCIVGPEDKLAEFKDLDIREL